MERIPLITDERLDPSTDGVDIGGAANAPAGVTAPVYSTHTHTHTHTHMHKHVLSTWESEQYLTALRPFILLGQLLPARHLHIVSCVHLALHCSHWHQVITALDEGTLPIVIQKIVTILWE